MNVYYEFFHTAEISEVNVILSYPWLHAVNPGINWKEQMWWYPINPEQIFIVDSEEFALKMKKTRQIFAVMLLFPIKTNQSTQVILPRELTDFQNVVTIEKRLMLFLHESAVHHIKMKNQKILYKPFYNLFSYELKVLCEYLNNALIKDWIQHSVSSAESSVLFVFKRNGSLWLCVNYQSLNKKMIKNYHFLSLINETLNCLVKFYYFIKLDLKDAYHWIQIAKRN